MASSRFPASRPNIHPLDGQHLLAIGEHRAEPDAQGFVNWSERSLKLTLFDVSNFAAPKEKFTALVGTSNGWSEAAYEHKAFNYFAQRKLLAIPFSDYTWDYSSGSYWDSFVSEVRVFEIDVNKGITPAGAVSLKDPGRRLCLQLRPSAHPLSGGRGPCALEPSSAPIPPRPAPRLPGPMWTRIKPAPVLQGVAGCRAPMLAYAPRDRAVSTARWQGFASDVDTTAHLHLPR